jgi:predicted NUDIX family phosphoesterase
MSNTNKENELILVVPRNSLEKEGMFQGFSNQGEKYLKALIDNGNASYTKRGPAEKDPSLKQIIPYCLVMQDGKILIYQRGKTGGEERLKSLWSCGIGGHINPIDSKDENAPFTRASLKKALLRELAEEISLPEGEVTFTTAGLINDDSNSVGEVHLGLVEIAEVPKGPISANEEAISNIKLVSPEELVKQTENLESWSQIVAANIKDILKK